MRLIFHDENGRWRDNRLLPSVRRGLGRNGCLRGRKKESKGASLSDLAVDVDETAVSLNNSIHDGQAQARAALLSFGGEEGFKDSLTGFLVHACPGVGDLDVRIGTVRFGKTLPHFSSRSLGCADRQRASLGHRVPGVETDIDERLLQLVVIALNDGEPWIQVESEIHGLGKYLPENVQGFPGETIDIEGLVFGAGLTGKSQQLLHDLGPALRSAQNHPNVAGTLRRIFFIWV